jgi:hypothetical protein
MNLEKKLLNINMNDIVKCPVHGCRKKLDSDNIPIEYCDYQQGRCPMYLKPNIDLKSALFFIGIFLLLLVIIWLTI